MEIDRLSVLDTNHLRMEDPSAPNTIGWVSIVDGVDLPEGGEAAWVRAVRRHVEGQLALVPRLRQRVRWLPVGLGLPIWVDDTDFDIARHVRHVTAPPGADQARLFALAEELFARPLDRNRPLWDIALVTGLPDRQAAVVQRIHHALADGVAAGAIAMTLLSSTASPGTPSTWAPRPPPPTPALLAGNLRWRAGVALHAVAHLRHPVRLAGRTRELIRQVREFAGERRGAELTSLNASLGARRHLAVLETTLTRVKDAGHAHGATVNDVLLAAVGGGLRALLATRGEAVPGPLTASVPVSVRAGGPGGGLGNRTSGIVAPLHADEPDPARRLLAITTATREIKARREMPAVVGVLDSPFIPGLVMRRAGRLMAHQRFITTYVTNVPGPPEPLSLLGARLAAIVPVVSITANVTLGIGAASYAGAFVIGVRSEPDRVPDLDVFLDGMQQTLDALAVTAKAPGAA